MAPLGAAVEAFDGGFLVAWADDRRLTNLARTPVAAGSDVWLKVVDRGFLASLRRPSHLVCPRSGLVGGPRLAPSTNGVVGLAWSDDRGVSLVRVGPTGLLDVPCGQAVSASRSSVVEVSPRGADFSVVFNGPSGLVRAAVVRGAVAVPVTLSFLPQSSVATVSSEMNGTVVGWLQASDVTVDNDGVNSVTVSGRAISGFDLIEGTSGPAIAYVGDGGLFVGSSPTTADLKSSASTRRPYGARTVDGGLVVVSATANTAQTQLFSTAGTASLGINNPPGRPEGVAMAPDDEGLALITTETGVLTAAGVVRRAQGYDFQGAAVVSVADVLQRRPTVAWSEASGAWELVWEEATTATTFVPRHGFLRPDDPSSLEVAASDLIVDGGTWPRVFQQFDGGLAYLTLDRQVTTFSVPRGAVTAPVDQLDASITWVAPGPAGGFVWADAPGLHQEFVLRQSALPIDDFLPGEVTCATWFADRYVVTRAG